MRNTPLFITGSGVSGVSDLSEYLSGDLLDLGGLGGVDILNVLESLLLIVSISNLGLSVTLFILSILCDEIIRGDDLLNGLTGDNIGGERESGERDLRDGVLGNMMPGKLDVEVLIGFVPVRVLRVSSVADESFLLCLPSIVLTGRHGIHELPGLVSILLTDDLGETSGFSTTVTDSLYW